MICQTVFASDGSQLVSVTKGSGLCDFSRSLVILNQPHWSHIVCWKLIRMTQQPPTTYAGQLGL